MPNDKRINYTFQIIKKLIHEGVIYLNYTVCMIAVVCILNTILVENIENHTIFNESSLKDFLNVSMAIGTISYGFREFSKYTFYTGHSDEPFYASIKMSEEHDTRME